MLNITTAKQFKDTLITAFYIIGLFCNAVYLIHAFNSILRTHGLLQAAGGRGGGVCGIEEEALVCVCNKAFLSL